MTGQSERDMPLRVAIEDALFGIEPPHPYPVDGACLKWEPWITGALKRWGLKAELLVIAGWLDKEQTTIAFLHHATIIDPTPFPFGPAERYIVDYTARQFHRRHFPDKLICPLREYLDAFRELGFVEAVTVFPPPPFEEVKR